jgi:hypothetical protein
MLSPDALPLVASAQPTGFQRVMPPALADAIMGVTFFSDSAPNDFGKFDQAVITLFRVTTGGTWVEAITFDDAGAVSHKGAIFLVTYIFVVNWTLLQVSVAVLLDRFISSSVDMQSEKRAVEEAKMLEKRHGRTALDPILRVLSKSTVDDADLSTRIQSLFKVGARQQFCSVHPARLRVWVRHAQRCARRIAHRYSWLHSLLAV